MKLRFTLLLLIFGLLSASAWSQQMFSDDFESYEVGDYLAEESSDWTTWSNNPGSSEDVRITDEFAFSGTHSIYFEGTGSSGGPQDVILPFGGLKTDGVFDFSMMVYIPSDGSGYFNFQGATLVGQTWAMDCYIEDNGRLIIGTGSTQQLSTTYQKEEWFELRIRSDMGNNLWSLYIDGNCLGSFSNPTNKVSHLDLFPLSGDAFYVDDVAYTYDPISPQIDKDYAISGIGWPTGRLAGSSARVNIGIENITGEKIDTAVIGLNVNGAQYLDTIEDLDLPAGESFAYAFPEMIVLESGTINMEARLMSVNGISGDDFTCNDIRSIVFNSVQAAPNKSVLVEEGTGTWCQWCPRGAVYMDLMKERYPGHFIPVAVHNNDPMMHTAYDLGVRTFPGFTGFPNVIVNRNQVVDPSNMEAPILDRVADTTAVVLKNGAQYDPDTRELEVSVTADIIEELNGDYRLFAVVTEDSVTGTGSGYAQVNAYAGGSNGPMGGYENLPNPVPADQMVYRYVARALLGGFAGSDASLPDQLQAGSQHIVNFSWTVPQSVDVDQLSVVSIMLRPDRSAENASGVTLDQAIENGFVTGITDPVIQAATELFPNPASDQTVLSLDFEQPQQVHMELVQSDGKVVEQRDLGTLQGEYSFPVHLDGLTPGMYYLRVRTGAGQAVKKLIVTPR